MNKKGITPIIAIILLLMMVVAVAAAAFYWLTKIQGQMQGGAEQYEEKSFERMASTIHVNSLNYNLTSKVLNMYLQNSGTTSLLLSDQNTSPTTVIKLADSDGNIICSGQINDDIATAASNKSIINVCLTGCNNNLEPTEIQQVQLNLTNTTCDLGGQANESAISLDLYLSGKGTASTIFKLKTVNA